MIFRASIVATIVGSVLLLINQYDALFSNAEIRTLPAILTYCVPFLVFIAGQLVGNDKH
ncbi:MAG: dihydrolipoamide dehydrogenase [Moraxellaceae bacterium]|nr:MAG: dihydrolipoamide dehydrogenase [Moraxellaceae bacterium]